MIQPQMKNLLKAILTKKTRIEAFNFAPRFSCYLQTVFLKITFGQLRNNLPCVAPLNSANLLAVSR